MEIEFELGNIYVTAKIEYKIWPAEPMVMYDSDGGGYPGSPAEIELLSVCVTSVSGATYDIDTYVCGRECNWPKDLDRLAFDHLEENLADGGWVEDHIAADAEAAEEQWSE